jgi:hypothetical protein
MKEDPGLGEPGSIAEWVRGWGLGHAIRRTSPTNALQANLFRSHARFFVPGTWSRGLLSRLFTP